MFLSIVLAFMVLQARLVGRLGQAKSVKFLELVVLVIKTSSSAWASETAYESAVSYLQARWNET